jgi:hypothetical protein
MSFLQPPEGFLPNLVCIWPLVWCQLLLLRVAVRAAYGQDARYYWSITPNGRAILTCIHFGLKDKTARDWLKPREHCNDRLAAACDGRAIAPAYTARCDEPHDAKGALVARGSTQACILNLLLPET